MKVNDTFQTLFGTATVIDHAITRRGDIRVEYRHEGDRPTDETSISTFDVAHARQIGLVD